jgi:hypothetical protein
MAKCGKVLAMVAAGVAVWAMVSGVAYVSAALAF